MYITSSFELAEMTFVKKFVQGSVMAIGRIGQNIDGHTIKYAANIGSAVAPQIAPSVKWDSVASSHGYQNFSNALDNVSGKITSSGKFLVQSYINAQADKEERAHDMIDPVLNELKDKGSEFLNLSLSEQLELKENLSEVKSSYTEINSYIKKGEKAVSLSGKLVGAELQTALALESGTMSALTRGVSIAAKVVTAVSPVARAANAAIATYEVAKVLYPEQTATVENYIKDKADEQLGRAKVQFSAVSDSISLSFKERIQEMKAKAVMNASVELSDEIDRSYSGPKI